MDKNNQAICLVLISSAIWYFYSIIATVYYLITDVVPYFSLNLFVILYLACSLICTLVNWKLNGRKWGVYTLLAIPVGFFGWVILEIVLFLVLITFGGGLSI